MKQFYLVGAAVLVLSACNQTNERSGENVDIPADSVVAVVEHNCIVESYDNEKKKLGDYEYSRPVIMDSALISEGDIDSFLTPDYKLFDLRGPVKTVDNHSKVCNQEGQFDMTIDTNIYLDMHIRKLSFNFNEKGEFKGLYDGFRKVRSKKTGVIKRFEKQYIDYTTYILYKYNDNGFVDEETEEGDAYYSTKKFLYDDQNNCFRVHYVQNYEGSSRMITDEERNILETDDHGNWTKRIVYVKYWDVQGVAPDIDTFVVSDFTVLDTRDIKYWR